MRAYLYGMYSTYFTVPSWYRPIGEIAPGCLLSAAALPGKAVCIIYQFSIAPIGEMAPGVPCKALRIIVSLHYRTGMREMAPIGEMAAGCAKKYKKLKKKLVCTRCHLTHDCGTLPGTWYFGMISGTYATRHRTVLRCAASLSGAAET